MELKNIIKNILNIDPHNKRRRKGTNAFIKHDARSELHTVQRPFLQTKRGVSNGVSPLRNPSQGIRTILRTYHNLQNPQQTVNY